ncbi:MAG: hypothetical protein KGL39_06345 [Patescibacteria group bacterium]|nr:hypothetical protein [Patescibacteria group bacterium]
MKWAALLMLLSAIIVFAGAMLWNKTASFEGGSFIGVILLFLLSFALAAGGIGTFAVLLFRAL